MAKDKRVKGCPDPLCERNAKKYKYAATDKFCTICGAELTFVCPVCFRKLADMGPDHILCAACQAEKADRKANSRKRLQYIGDKVGGAARAAAKEVSDRAVDAAGAVVQTYDKAAAAVSEGAKDARDYIADRLPHGKDEADFPFCFPENYSQIKKKPPKGAGIPKGAVIMGSANEGSKATIVCFPVPAESSMPFEDSEVVINLLRKELSDSEGIIAVDSGVSHSGKEYVYNIRKRKHQEKDEIPIVEYALNMNIKQSEEVWFINGSFIEVGMTGVRDATMYAVYRMPFLRML